MIKLSPIPRFFFALSWDPRMIPSLFPTGHIVSIWLRWEITPSQIATLCIIFTNFNFLWILNKMHTYVQSLARSKNRDSVSDSISHLWQHWGKHRGCHINRTVTNNPYNQSDHILSPLIKRISWLFNDCKYWKIQWQNLLIFIHRYKTPCRCLSHHRWAIGHHLKLEEKGQGLDPEWINISELWIIGDVRT